MTRRHTDLSESCVEGQIDDEVDRRVSYYQEVRYLTVVVLNPAALSLLVGQNAPQELRHQRWSLSSFNISAQFW
jgi:hypothetical protein